MDHLNTVSGKIGIVEGFSMPRKLSEWALTIVILVAAILIVGLW